MQKKIEIFFNFSAKKSTNSFIFVQAKLAKLRRDLITPKGGGGGPGEGFDVAKTGDARIGFVGVFLVEFCNKKLPKNCNFL